MMGDMRGIQAWASDLETRNDSYAHFASVLREMAGGFKAKAIMEFVKQYKGSA
jgi:hypothetical protein